MTSTACKYAQIEKEALAVTWACERSSNYIVGKSITIETDHKPLVLLLMKHTSQITAVITALQDETNAI